MIKIILKGTESFGKAAIKIRNIKMAIPDMLKKICDKFGNKTVRLAKEKYILNGGYDAPVDPIRITSRSGNLRRNIFFNTKVDNFKAWLTVGVHKQVPYAHIHEFGGTSRSSRGKSFFIKARPYLTPAIEEGLAEFKDDLKNILKRIHAEKK